MILEPFLPEPPLVISSGPLVGLGDIAVYSTLAERFHKELGYDVFIDKDNAAGNPEIYELFWEKNPYIKGLSDRKPNAGYARQGLFYYIANRLPGYRSIEAMERAHALPPPYNMAPKVYYEPKPFHLDLTQSVLVDFSAMSSKIGIRGLREAFEAANARFDDPPLVQVLHKRRIAMHTPQIAAPSYELSSIYEYLDMLHACRAWIGSEAGGQSLASAVRGEHDVYDQDARLEVSCTITPRTFNSRGYTYRNVDYHVTSDCESPADYWKPHEVEVLKYEAMCLQRLQATNP